MRLPVIQGLIRRRILVNFRVEREVMQRVLPSRFRPKLHEGYAVAGVCLIRLEKIRPAMMPEVLGISSENAAHRVAVEWEEEGAMREGVFISRRDTNSHLNHLTGGRVFPGEHQLADFTAHETEDEIALSYQSRDGQMSVNIAGRRVGELPRSSIFSSIADSSAFFEKGSVGFSVTKDEHRLDGIALKTEEWKVEPLALDAIYSSYFADERIFPASSIHFDHALIMRNVAHEWRDASSLVV